MRACVTACTREHAKSTLELELRICGARALYRGTLAISARSFDSGDPEQRVTCAARLQAWYPRT
jgi:hypothetical protein